MTPYKNRVIDYTKPVLVYRNLHKGGYSIKQNGLVVAHCNNLYLYDCDFIVREGGRQRVLKEKQKNIHAFIKGYIRTPNQINFDTKVTYNPYKHDTFVVDNLPISIYDTEWVNLNESGVWI